MAAQRSSPPAPASADSSGDQAPVGARDRLSGFVLGIAAANVIMQLSRLPVAYGVAESKVDSGRLDRHPLKRLRTTLSYIMVALYGTESEREIMRREVNRAHRQVRSEPSSPVRYNAFDRELQLWVAACLYWGLEDFNERMYGPLDPATKEFYYRHGARFGTTLQVTADMWPTDREAFEDYWKAGLREVRMDDLSRAYLRGLAGLRFLPKPVWRTFGPFHQFVTAGFLPPLFREELGLPWSPRQQQAFDKYVKATARINAVLPRPIREFPFNVYLWDFRYRVRTGRAIV